MIKCLNLEFDVCLSFAGEDREYVEELARHLIEAELRVFYDKHYKVNLWGKDLYQYLDDIYQNKAKFTIIFISKHYKKKLWTRHELKSAQARAFSQSEDYILPVRFDNTEIPGIRKTLGYIHASEITIPELADLILTKVKSLEVHEFLPENNFFIKTIANKVFCYKIGDIESLIFEVFEKLLLLKKDEREFLAKLILASCWHDISEDIHESIEVIERSTGLFGEDLLKMLKNISHVGFSYNIYNHAESSDNPDLMIEHLSLKLISSKIDIIQENLTFIWMLMILSIVKNHCKYCAFDLIKRLDFSTISEKPSKFEINSILEKNLNNSSYSF